MGATGASTAVKRGPHAAMAVPQGGTVVNHDRQWKADVLVHGGVIVDVGQDLVVRQVFSLHTLSLHCLPTVSLHTVSLYSLSVFTVGVRRGHDGERRGARPQVRQGCTRCRAMRGMEVSPWGCDRSM
jgi:hypothetical protein